MLILPNVQRIICPASGIIVFYVVPVHVPVYNRIATSRKHLRTKVTPDFHLTYSKNGENWGRIQNDKSEEFLYFSIKSYAVDVY